MVFFLQDAKDIFNTQIDQTILSVHIYSIDTLKETKKTCCNDEFFEDYPCYLEWWDSSYTTRLKPFLH